MQVSPHVVTVPAAAQILTAYIRDVVTALRASGREDLRRLARQAKRDRLDRGITAKQVRLLATAIAEPSRMPTSRGDSLLLDAVEVGVLAIAVQIRVMAMSGGARLWTGLASNAVEIRHGLRHPAARLGVQVDAFGRVAVVPVEQVDPTLYLFDLARLRSDVDARIADRRREQPWEWSEWRRTPAKELRVVS